MLLFSIALFSLALAQTNIGSFTGGTVYKLSNGVFYFNSKGDCDADGAARAYNPSNTGIDALANAGSSGNWYGLATTSGGTPLKQGPNDPQPGYYISATALASKAPSTSQCRYVDSEKISYFVLPGSSSLRSSAGYVMGDFAVIYYKSTGLMSYSFYGDVGPSSKIGEDSILLLTNLGYNPWNRAKTKVVSGASSGVVHIVFPKSGFGQGYVPTNRDTNVHARAAFKYYGGCALMNQIVGTTVSSCSLDAPLITKSIDYSCNGAYGIMRTCASGGACATQAVCKGWGGSWTSGGCGTIANVGCCSVSGYDSSSSTDPQPTMMQGGATPEPTEAPPAGGIPCSYKAVDGVCTTQDGCSTTWTTSSSGASGCESEPDEVRCCTAGTPMMSTVQGVGPCSYKGVNGQCTDSCPSGYSTKKYSQGALGCKSFAADVLCCVPTASLLYDAGDDTTGDPNGEQPASSSMTLSSGDNINIVVGVVLAAIIVIGVAVAVVIFLVVRRRQQNLSM